MPVPLETPASSLLFLSANRRYAVLAERAHELVVSPSLSIVPGAPPHRLGVFIHRGEVIPVVDVSALLGRSPQAADRVLLLRVPQGPLALTVSTVLGLKDLVHPTSAVPEPEGVQAALLGALTLEDGPVEVLDVARLFTFLSQPL